MRDGWTAFAPQALQDLCRAVPACSKTMAGDDSTARYAKESRPGFRTLPVRVADPKVGSPNRRFTDISSQY